MVELPSDVVLDDYTYYYYSCAVEPSHRVTYTNQEYIQMLKEEFDGIAAEGDKIMVLKLHPAIIGSPWANQTAWRFHWVYAAAKPGSPPAKK